VGTGRRRRQASQIQGWSGKAPWGTRCFEGEKGAIGFVLGESEREGTLLRGEGLDEKHEGIREK